MIKQNQLVFKQFLSDVEDWCLEILTSNQGSKEDSRSSWLSEIRGILKRVQHAQEQQYIYESDILDIKRCVEKTAEGMRNVSGSRVNNGRVPIGQHTLPPLPYPYNALEPYISREIMELHHQKHHKSYVDGLNKAEMKMLEARETGDFDLIKHWEREAAFHGSGHYLHTMFWDNMSPNGGGHPSGRLMQQIVQDFGSYEKFKKHFSEAADKVEGVGWALLVWSPRAHRLEILQTEKQQLFTQWDTIPLLGLDVWEHAYYLQYKNNRKDYIDKWWNLVNWKDVEKRYQEASRLKWKPY
ncbi:superoxide dismutase [Sutcliffiella horikoshii]|uniref:superoxide dismutase n=1 Tax=Sutcliffiella horikoshii TaxID=79883 RepID=A0ABM6KKN6_9BACI|nr:superoxide dismutase [Sutcliffiella horikoshii]ART76926.1 superoxide dismutase [Sutcliffiella horikoshii]